MSTTQTPPNILERIKAYKLEFVAAARRVVPEAAQREAALAAAPARGFAAAVRGARGAGEPRGANAEEPLRVVAEVKRASPSAGIIREDFDPVAIARGYEAGGAAAISCLTDEEYFKGSLEYLKAIRGAIALPILRKDFTLDAYQVWEARAAGADAVLLIAGFVEWSRLRELRAVAREAGLDVLLEIHGEHELEPALELAPDVFGINNRDLRGERFLTDLASTERLAPRVPREVPLLSESGIKTAQDIARVAACGVDGVLVGEHLMRETDPGAAIAAKLGLGRRG